VDQKLFTDEVAIIAFVDQEQSWLTDRHRQQVGYGGISDVISQLGTLIVHRLTNDEDQHAVERACGDLNREAALFIPTLAPGEAIVVGPDLPAPVPVLVHEPPPPPNSKGPNYTKF
jgi:hypothetical protein